jgi:hypothetical protein
MLRRQKFFLLTWFFFLAVQGAPVFAQDDNGRSEPYTEGYDQEEEERNRVVFSEIALPLSQKDRTLNEQSWKKMTADKSFQYTDTKPATPKENNMGDAWNSFWSTIWDFLQSGAGKVLIWVLVALLLLFVIFRLVQLNGNIFFAKRDKNLNQETEDELSDQYLPADWEKTITDAARAGNYRLAVRHGYRYLLFLLGEKELIRFQTAKTNYQYAYELSGTALHKPFMQLTRQYEYAWYGGFDIEKSQFEQYYRLVTQLKEDIN